jgi:VCBS repeat protein
MVVPAAPALATPPTAIGLDTSTLDTGGAAWGTQIADVTGDGRADLIVTNHGSGDPSLDHKVIVYPQNAGGTFDAPQVYAPSATPTGNDFWLFPATGDLNDDGFTDLAIGHESGLDVFLQSAGALTGPTSFASTGSVHGVQVADLNGDGMDDVVYAVRLNAGGYKYIRRFQKLDHTLAGAVQIGSGSAERFTVGDVSGDGNLDVILEDPGSGVVSIFVHNALDQDFTQSDETRVGEAVATAVADVNDDTINDLLVLQSGKLLLLAGEAAGTLADPVTVTATPNQAFALEVADVNGDAARDVVVFEAGETEVLLQDGTGALLPGCPFPSVAPNPLGGNETVALGDLTGDGRPDAAGAEEAVPVRLLTQLAPSITTASTITGSPSPTTVELHQTVTVSGQLQVQTGGCLDRVPVEIWRHLPDGSSSMIGTATLWNDTDGTAWSFTFEDAAPVVGTVQYKAVWPGDAFHDPDATTYKDVTVTKKATSLGLTVSDPTIKAGDSTKLIASLTGGADPRTVDFYKVAGGVSTLVGSVVATSPGRAVLPVSPRAGTSSYYARYEGNDTWAASKSPKVAVTAKKLATSIDLDINRSHVVFGDTATLNAHLRGGADVSRIGFYALSGGHRRLLDTVRADPRGIAKLIVTPSRNTTYIAAYAGTNTWTSSTSDQVNVKVAVRLSGQMTRFISKKKRVAVYNCCRAFYFFKVAPNHGGKSVAVRVEYYQHGWQLLGTQNFKLGKNSSREIYINVTGGIGYLFRVRACFPGDADHLGGCADHALFRYRKKP